MKIKSIQPAATARLVVAVVAVCLLAIGASAQFGGPSVFSGTFTLPYEVHWGGTVLPAGPYSINMESAQQAAIVRSANGKINTFLRIPVIADPEKGTGTYLTIVHRGNESRIQALNAPQMGKMLIYEPLTKAEREELTKAGHVQTLFVATAKK